MDDVSGKLDSNRPVPFRMTPNITEFVTPVGVSGPLTASMISAARCFVQPSFKIASILRAVLRDEMIAWNKKNGGANGGGGNGANANSTSAAASNSPDAAPTNNIEQENRDKEVIFFGERSIVAIIYSSIHSGGPENLKKVQAKKKTCEIK